MTDANGQVREAPRRNGLAFPALLLALLGWLIPICQPVALVLGIIALVQIVRSRGQQTGLGMTVTGLVLSVLWTVMFAYLGLVAVPKIRETARRMNCASNLRSIGLVLQQYAMDNNGKLPPDFNPLYPDYIDNPKVFSCPSDPSEWMNFSAAEPDPSMDTSYVYVSSLDATDKAECALVYDRPRNHGEHGVNVVFLDAHVEWVTLKRLKELLDRTRALARENGREARLVYE